MAEYYITNIVDYLDEFYIAELNDNKLYYLHPDKIKSGNGLGCLCVPHSFSPDINIKDFGFEVFEKDDYVIFAKIHEAKSQRNWHGKDCFAFKRAIIKKEIKTAWENKFLSEVISEEEKERCLANLRCAILQHFSTRTNFYPLFAAEFALEVYKTAVSLIKL